ncbi:MAG: malto-oligosyltrehalose trehalohydrolase [Rhodovulum sulfidophilum]|uniref:Malto-oligosyltrehalose trehalohydrolase n=1 Tax=Rhodovulum sulfidophilum TaxID=35806 RepID=A0A2W5MYB7_RHOSU|nr:MAG: malto-oligosyltrehalose trehalohydrolase [Rhodovulum sulfidophilum]
MTALPAPLWGPLPAKDGTRFRLWAPAETAVALRWGGADHPMRRDAEGWFELTRPARAGEDYAFVLGDGLVVPDPAARAQAGCDVHGPSRLVDPDAYRWRDAGWRGRPWAEAAILEIHVGTFTPEGTFRAAAGRLAEIAASGFTAVELMPVAQFAGRRGWGYDGVLPYAPHPAYGTPDDLRALVDAAHGLGLMVLLDVVYNHFGPEGNYLPRYAPAFFHPESPTPWGAAIAYDRAPVRRFFIENALYWIGAFHLDGLRLDAIDHVRDPDSPVEILVEIAETLRAAFPDREIHLTTEDNRNVTHLHERGPDGGVPRYTAEWNDDLHNAAHVLATGETEGYYVDFADDALGKFARALAEGFAYQGEPSPHAGDAPRGAPSAHLPPGAFVDFLQNHDQIGNRAHGERLVTLAPPPRVRALMAILLLAPHAPLLFMGEDWGETRPFAFFTDFEGELADKVREGRRAEFQGFAAFGSAAARAAVPDPNAEDTFAASRIDWARRDTPEGRDWRGFTSDLLALRLREIAPRLAAAPGHGGRVLHAADGALALAWRLDGATLRLRANLSDQPRAVPVAPGRVLHAWNGAGADPLMPPWSTLWTMDADT